MCVFIYTHVSTYLNIYTYFWSMNVIIEICLLHPLTYARRALLHHMSRPFKNKTRLSYLEWRAPKIKSTACPPWQRHYPP